MPKASDHSLTREQEITFSRFITFDRVAQRYGGSPFDVPSKYTMQQIELIDGAMREEAIYEKKQMDKAKRGK